MTHSVATFFLRSEFDAFLFAPIEEDRNGMLLSVVSALARLDVDPWQEAADLARLPRETAVQRLATVIAGLPHGLSARPDPGVTAARLVALLPHEAGSNTSVRQASFGAAPSIQSKAAIYAILYVIFIAFVMGGQCSTANRNAPAQLDKPRAPNQSTVLPDRSPPISDQ
jgi:hypothetical protein